MKFLYITMTNVFELPIKGIKWCRDFIKNLNGDPANNHQILSAGSFHQDSTWQINSIFNMIIEYYLNLEFSSAADEVMLVFAATARSGSTVWCLGSPFILCLKTRFINSLSIQTHQWYISIYVLLRGCLAKLKFRLKTIRNASFPHTKILYSIFTCIQNSTIASFEIFSHLIQKSFKFTMKKKKKIENWSPCSFSSWFLGAILNFLNEAQFICVIWSIWILKAIFVTLTSFKLYVKFRKKIPRTKRRGKNDYVFIQASEVNRIQPFIRID